MGDIADAAAIDNRGFLFFSQEFIEFGIVAGGHDEGVDRPFIAVYFNRPVLYDAEVHLHEIFLIFVDLVAEVNAAAGYPGQGPPAQVETIGVVGVGDMQKPLNRLLAQQVDGRGGDFIFGRIFTGNRTETLRQGDRDDFDKLQHVFQFASTELPDVIPDVGGTGTERSIVLPPFLDHRRAQPITAGQMVPGVVRRFEQIHGQNHGVFVGLRFYHVYVTVVTKLAQAFETEGVAPVFLAE